MGEKKFLTASEARNLANTSEKLINCTARNIKEAAEDGQQRYRFHSISLTDKAIEAIVNKFTSLGYTVDVVRTGIDAIERLDGQLDTNCELDRELITISFTW